MVTNIRQVTPWDFPEVPGYMTVAQVAKLYGVSKENVYYKIYTQRRFRKVFRVGKNRNETTRPVLLLDEAEVRAMHARETAVSYDKQLLEYNRRVKEWARRTGWRSRTGTPTHLNGPPHRELVEAYTAANPQDPPPWKDQLAEESDEAAEESDEADPQTAATA